MCRNILPNNLTSLNMVNFRESEFLKYFLLLTLPKHYYYHLNSFINKEFILSILEACYNNLNSYVIFGDRGISRCKWRQRREFQHLTFDHITQFSSLNGKAQSTKGRVC